MSVIAAVDGEQIPSRPVEVGYDLAQQYGEELFVVHVMPQEEFDEYSDPPQQKVGSSGPEWRYRDLPVGNREGETPRRFGLQDGKQTARGLARKVVNETLEEWDNISFLGLVGDPAEELIEETQRRQPRFLVLGGRKRSPLGKALFGSTSQKVLLNVDIPVVTVIRDE